MIKGTIANKGCPEENKENTNSGVGIFGGTFKVQLTSTDDNISFTTATKVKAI